MGDNGVSEELRLQVETGRREANVVSGWNQRSNTAWCSQSELSDELDRSLIAAQSKQLMMDIWHLIGRQDPATYYVLVQCCKDMKQPINIMMELFTRCEVVAVDSVEYTCTVLPRGIPHSIKDIPAIVVRYCEQVIVEVWYDSGFIHRRDVEQPAICCSGTKASDKYTQDIIRYEIKDALSKFEDRNNFIPRWSPYFNGDPGWVGWYSYGKLRMNGQPNVVVNTRWKLYFNAFGYLDRGNDLPAIVAKDEMLWYKNGYNMKRKHGKPNHVRSEYVAWKNKYGKLHRDDGPARVYANGSEFWYYCGKRRPEPLWYSIQKWMGY